VPLESDPTHQNSPTPNAHREAEGQTTQGDPDMAIIPSVPAPPPPKTHCEITCKTEKDFWDHVKTGAEIFGIVLLAIYTGYTVKMYCANKQAADAATSAAKTAKDTLITSSRPWLGLDGTVTTDVLEKSPIFKIAGHYTIKNFGQGPAIRFFAFSEPVWDSEGENYMTIGRSACNIPIQFITNTRNPGPMGSILFPAQTHPQGIGDGGPWRGNASAPNVKHIWVVGCIAYLDQFKALHWTRFCVESSYFAKAINKDTPLQFCALYNDTEEDQNKK
jgi:hypothetical protein